jgi:hypothetical protein
MPSRRGTLPARARKKSGRSQIGQTDPWRAPRSGPEKRPPARYGVRKGFRAQKNAGTAPGKATVSRATSCRTQGSCSSRFRCGRNSPNGTDGQVAGNFPTGRPGEPSSLLRARRQWPKNRSSRPCNNGRVACQTQRQPRTKPTSEIIGCSGRQAGISPQTLPHFVFAKRTAPQLRGGLSTRESCLCCF